MLKKSLAVAAVATAAAMAPADADAGDPALGALLGAALGAAIGHSVDGRHGAAVGGFVGAVAGAGIAADSHRRYGPAPVVVPYPPAPAYYAPQPVYRPGPGYYAPPVVIVRPRPVAVRPYYAPAALAARHAVRHPRHGHRIDHVRHWR